ncbi:aminotransferase class IV [Ureibacillus acetophenoni]|uniref:4-amino-4-deoxychorismate lyase n=1 Tax=Ureibacillus acetophenoni TaxID=614649 RepID=A0A285USM7_9BACL|nr:aminotransferase class IV [Ureibacillus acetophenoni]SOC44809.1 4-amino-4-deoxychorismate lyase [Ureibacillus acetophenoni]
MILWMNGKYINDSECGISPLDHGYLYGFTFFEKFRTYKGQVILFQEHYNQLIKKLNQFHIKMPHSVMDVYQVIKELSSKDQDKNNIFLLSVSAGNAHPPLQFQETYNHPNVMIIRTELFPRKRGVEKSAKWLEVSNGFSINENKYLGSLEISDPEHIEGLLITERGIITEGLTSTIFFAKEGTLFTPSLSLGVSPSVIRQWVINTAIQMGYRVVEDLFIKKDLEEAYECFVANSVEELIPISNIGNIKFLGRDGTIYQRLHQAYIEEILKTVRKGEC